MDRSPSRMTTVVELGEAASDPSRVVSELEEEEFWEDLPEWREEPVQPDESEGDESGEISPESPPAELDFLLISWLGRDERGEPVSGTILVHVAPEAAERTEGTLLSCGSASGKPEFYQ